MDFERIINFRGKWQTYVFDVAILSLLGWFILFLANFLSKQKFLQMPGYITDSLDLVLITAFFMFLVLFFALVKVFFNWLWVRTKKDRSYKFSSQDWPNKWIFNGSTVPENISDLKIQSSRAGCLLDNYFWKNFRMSFEAKFVHSMKIFGVIFRAEDLNNYFMIEIAESSVNPRVRYSSGWEEIESTSYSLKSDDFFVVVLEVKDETACLYIQGKFVLSWILPNYVDVNHWEAGVKVGNNNENKKEKIEQKPLAGHVQKIFFGNRPGKIGFRAHQGQGAIIRGLTIEPL